MKRRNCFPSGIHRASWFGALLAAGSGTSGAREFDFSKYSTKVRNFISDTVFDVEAGDREKQSKRLPGAVSLNVHGDAAAKAMVEGKLAMFLAATGVQKDALEAGGGKPAQLEVHIGESGKLIPEAAAISKDISLDRGHTYWVWWDDERFVTAAVVFICTDRVAAGRTEDKLVENLFHVFGFPSTSKATDMSCLSESDPELHRPSAHRQGDPQVLLRRSPRRIPTRRAGQDCQGKMAEVTCPYFRRERKSSRSRSPLMRHRRRARANR